MIPITNGLRAYRVAELVTFGSRGLPGLLAADALFADGKVAFATGYMYPSKANNAKRNPHVAVLFSDPTASGRAESDPLTRLQGTAQVLDDDP